jgi:ubiquinone/menaquinone biosynthesis C-methylase UbiE
MKELGAIGNYWNTRAEGYSLSVNAELDGEEEAFWEGVLRQAAPIAKDGENLRCLDVGCGPGFFSILLAEQGWNVTAVDYSEGMLEKARANFATRGVTVTPLRGDAQHLPFADGAFDFIVSRNLVWNLEEPRAAYGEWFRLLGPGGRLLVADANHYLSYYDEAYREAASGTIDADKHKYMLGVDPAPINEIARDLPLSRVRRPDWDVGACLAIGFNQVSVQVGRKGGLVWDFSLQAGR